MFVARCFPATSQPVPQVDVDHANLNWLAGLLEGEGSFFPGPPSNPGLPVLQVGMADRDVMARVGRLLRAKVHEHPPKKREWKTTYTIALKGSRAVAWMITLWPLLGERRRSQVERAVASYKPRSNHRLTDQTALEALALLADGRSVKEVAARFDVTVWCIYDLRLNRTFCHLIRPTSGRAKA